MYDLRPEAEIKEVLPPPSHYSRYEPQPIVAIEGWNLGFHLGNVVKYCVRAAHKGEELRDLKKALWYLDRYIALKEGKAGKPEEQV
jgi:hypothetical protein